MIPGASTLLRTLLIYSLCIPLAVFVGYIVTDPLNASTFVEMGLVLFFLAIPLLLRWHRLLLILCWNMGAILFFLPGQPELWLAMAWISLVFAVVQYVLNPRQPFVSVPSISRPLMFLALVLIATAFATGGAGLAAFGSETYGGKKYVVMLSAIVGFFALTSQRIPPRRALLYVTIFFAGSAVLIVGDFAGWLAPGMYWIYLILPVSQYGFEAVVNDPSAPVAGIQRLGNVALGCSALIAALLARYSLRDLLGRKRALQFLLLLALIAISTIGGFRLFLIQSLLLLGILFYLEGLTKSRLLPVVVLAMVLCGALIVAFSERLPLNVQRTLSFLPVKIDPLAKMSAQDSNEWRLEMWRNLYPEIPHYLLLGKGLGFSASDLRAMMVTRPGTFGTMASEGSALAGDYHSGPLSILIPFGIWGAIGFVWFIAASIRALYQNYRFGHPAFHRLNTFLLAYFVTRTFLFLVVFGAFYTDLAVFTGLIGLSIAINGGIAKPVRVPAIALRPRVIKFRPARASAVPVNV